MAANQCPFRVVEYGVRCYLFLGLRHVWDFLHEGWTVEHGCFPWRAWGVAGLLAGWSAEAVCLLGPDWEDLASFYWVAGNQVGQIHLPPEHRCRFELTDPIRYAFVHFSFLVVDLTLLVFFLGAHELAPWVKLRLLLGSFRIRIVGGRQKHFVLFKVFGGGDRLNYLILNYSSSRVFRMISSRGGGNHADQDVFVSLTLGKTGQFHRHFFFTHLSVNQGVIFLTEVDAFSVRNWIIFSSTLHIQASLDAVSSGVWRYELVSAFLS